MNMSKKPFSLLVAMIILSNLVACSKEQVEVTSIVNTVIETVIVTSTTEEQPTHTAAATTQEPTTAPAEVAQEPTAVSTTRPGYLSRDKLIEDARLLAQVIENSHPDPYTRGGGKIAYHRRLHRLLTTIPEEGLTKDEFIRLLRPFVAAVGDSHTYLGHDYRVNDHTPGGVPLLFALVEGFLYVAGVPDEAHIDLIGATLVSVEGVPLAELCERQSQLVGIENEYDVRQHLVEESLWYKPHLEDLIPEWEDTSQIVVELELPDGEVAEIVFDLPVSMNSLLTPDSEVTLPSARNALEGSRDLFYDLLDPEQEIAYLRATVMENYREAEEIHHPGCNTNTFVSTPSATKLFKSMVINMKEAGTKTLIVDLRDNQGGTSFLSRILLYFLFGSEEIMARIDELDGQCRVERYSDLSLQQYRIPVNPNDTLSWDVGDYYFSPCWSIDPDDPQAPQGRYQNLDLAAFRELLAAKYQEQSPTFHAEFVSGEYDGYYRPKNLVVLVNPKTFSSAASMARDLYIMGGTLVGTPSGQSQDDNFGESLLFTLPNSAIPCYVSHSYFKYIPDNPEMGRVLPVHFPLTYEKLASYGFDPNSAYLYALEILPELVEMPYALFATVPDQKPAESPTETTTNPSTGSGYRFTRAELIEDTRQLAQSLESAHPDPYIRGGGIIAFHYRLQQLLNAIPEGGMTSDEFMQLLRPFVVAVGDSHTDIWGDYETSDSMPGGVPLHFGVVGESLYVDGVPRIEQEINTDLFGAKLLSVEGVPLAEIYERQKRLAPLENQYNVLDTLTRNTLWYRPYLQELLPEWEDPGKISVELQLPSGSIEAHTFTIPENIPRLYTPNSQVRFPSTGPFGFRYDFMGTEGEIAYLNVDHLGLYREAQEMATNEPAPHLQSATETFRDLVLEMDAAGTDTLIIDLRGNQGGHSVMGDILVYFLYGKETLLGIQLHAAEIGGGMIRKYSDLFFERTQSWTSLEQVNEGRTLPLRANDYDFSSDFFDDVERFSETKADAIAHCETSWFGRSPTFWEEYQSETFSGYYCPENVLVLTDSGTFSSGFTMARYLYLAGATLVGTPSSQAANSFGNGQLWHLNYTGVQGTVSTTYSVEFPDDSELARVLPVHYPLTYEKLASYSFDPNAAYLYALELLLEPGE
jgi:hypothetical protein